MIEEILINYGVAGAMLIYFITDKYIAQKENNKYREEIKKVVENNTIALTKFYEVMKPKGTKDLNTK